MPSLAEQIPFDDAGWTDNLFADVDVLHEDIL